MVMCTAAPCRRLLAVGVAITCLSSSAVAFTAPQPLQASSAFQISSSERLHVKHSSSARQSAAPTMSLGFDWARSKLQQRRRARLAQSFDSSLTQQQQQQQSVRCSAQSSAEDKPLSYLDQLSQQTSSSAAAAITSSETSENSSDTASTTTVSAETDAAAAIQGIVPNKEGKLVWGSDLARDFRVRFLPYYKDDWKCGLTAKSVPAIMFLCFACLLPAVAFGGIAVQVTAGSLGVIEYLVACGSAGMVYALFSGQVHRQLHLSAVLALQYSVLQCFGVIPYVLKTMTFPVLPLVLLHHSPKLSTTTTANDFHWSNRAHTGLYDCTVWLYQRYGATISTSGASNLIRYATQFTDDVFNALLAVNFIYEASRSLLRNFSMPGMNKSGAFLALNMALTTYICTKKTVQARQSRYFNEEIREFLSDFGPVLVIMAMSVITQVSVLSSMGIEFLKVPTQFMLANGRSWFSPMLSIPVKLRLLCAIPATLLTSLFFLDQNISSRVVNSPKHNMKKPAAYHQDLMVLGLITGVLSILGLPWQCAATVQSLNHVRAMSQTDIIEKADGSKEEVIREVCENRVTGFSIHALILASVAMLPLLKMIPMPVVSGIFLYLGRKVMSGNEFLSRIKELVADRTMLTPCSAVTRVGYKTAASYTLVQVGMLSLLWTLKSFQQTALFFPSVIGLLVLVRLAILPKMFTPKELDELDSAVA
eukprot:10197-Heterococcus_DN1.PRE.2